jgi:hypothetical protein
MRPTRTRTNPWPAFACAAATFVAAGDASWAQLRIVSFNTANAGVATPRTGMDLILQAIATTVSDDPNLPGNTGIAKPIDVLAIQESAGWATTGVAYASLLNTLVPGANYQVAQLDGASTGAGTQTLVFNANSVGLINTGTKAFGTTGLDALARQVTRFQLRPVGYGADADVYVYNSHMKSSTGSANQARRQAEALEIRADADALPANSNVIYLGDLNVYRATEPAYQTLLSPGNGQAFDPINKPGSWAGSQAFQNVHTQSPYNAATAAALGTGFTGTTGGMDDRFDFQLLTANLVDGKGLAYIPNSYQAFGNDGSMAWGSGGNSINQGGNTAQPQNVLDAMASILDHLPVVADYQLPARIGVTVAAMPPRVIHGTPHAATISVSNAAPVAYAIGADTLDYDFSTTGDFTAAPATVTGKAALSPADAYTVTLATAALGPHGGTIHVGSTSEQVGNGPFNQTLDYAVVDHSNGSFDAGADVDSLAIDFGYVPLTLPARGAPFTIANRPAPSGYTAELALAGVTAVGSSQFSHDLGGFTNVPAGSPHAHAATLTPSTAGTATATFTLHAADEAIPGATPNATSLSLTVTARVIDSAIFPADGFIRLEAGETYATGPFSIAAAVTLTKTGPGTLHVTGPQTNGADSSLVVAGGIAILSTDANQTLSLSTQNSGTAHLASPQHLASLSVASGTAVTLAPGGGNLLTADAISIAGTLDLADNDALLATSAETARALLLSARNGGNWSGTGITSSSAAADPNDVTAIGYTLTSPSSVLLKYTWYGDANLNGLVELDDYSLVDRGLLSGLSGWTGGDFDYSGSVDLGDYLLLDRAFALQSGGTLSPSLLADRTARFGDSYAAALTAAVPEPNLALLLASAAAAFIMHRRRTTTHRRSTTETP